MNTYTKIISIVAVLAASLVSPTSAFADDIPEQAPVKVAAQGGFQCAYNSDAAESGNWGGTYDWNLRKKRVRRECTCAQPNKACQTSDPSERPVELGFEAISVLTGWMGCAAAPTFFTCLGAAAATGGLAAKVGSLVLGAKRCDKMLVPIKIKETHALRYTRAPDVHSAVCEVRQKNYGWCDIDFLAPDTLLTEFYPDLPNLQVEKSCPFECWLDSRDRARQLCNDGCQSHCPAGETCECTMTGLNTSPPDPAEFEKITYTGGGDDYYCDPGGNEPGDPSPHCNTNGTNTGSCEYYGTPDYQTEGGGGATTGSGGL